MINNSVVLPYLAFAKAVERPTNLTFLSVCDDIYLILETITCDTKEEINLKERVI